MTLNSISVLSQWLHNLQAVLAYLFQGRHGEFEPDKAHSTVVGIICPPG
jgi:hypothetical protein